MVGTGWVVTAGVPWVFTTNALSLQCLLFHRREEEGTSGRQGGLSGLPTFPLYTVQRGVYNFLINPGGEMTK